MRNLKAENQKLKVKCRKQRINLQALQLKLTFISKSDEKKAQELSTLEKENSQLTKEVANLKKEIKKPRKQES